MNGHNQFKTALDNAIKQLSKFTKEIESIRQQLEPEITEGQYVFIDGFQEMHRVVEFDSVDNTYGVVPISGKDNGSWEKRHSLRIACDKEVEQALIKEAKRRGFDEGVKIDRPSTYTNQHGQLEPTRISGSKYKYYPPYDQLELGGIAIYRDGEFAKIIEDEWEVKQYDLPGGQYYVSNGNREIDGVMESLSKREAQAIANALNNLDND